MAMTEEIEKHEHSDLLRQLELTEEAGILALKGYTYSNIGEILDVSPYKAKQYVEEYHAIIQELANEDPYFLEKIQYNTIKALREYDEISKEAWETVNIATDNGMVTARVQALKLAMECATKKAQLHQLMGGAVQSDVELIARMQKAERVNQLLSQVIRDVISEYPEIANKARLFLQEAFSIMEIPTVEVVDES